jgi:hypothetical protein
MAFAALLVLTTGSLAWLHVTVMRLRAAGAVAPRYAVSAVAQPTGLTLEPGVEQAGA